MILRRFLMLAPLALIAAFLIAMLTRTAPRGPNPPESPLLDKPVPVFELAGYDALHPGLASADLQRGTPTVVNVFASWCVPCRVEAPRLAALAAGGAVVHGIAVHDTTVGLGGFFRAYGNPFRRIGMDSNSAVSTKLQVAGLPETFVVDGRGVVRWHHRGELRAEDADALRSALKDAR